MAKKTSGRASEPQPSSSGRIGAENSGNSGYSNGNGNMASANDSPSESGDIVISNDEIAARAYEIYEREGRGDGRDMDHWLRAESELRSERRNQPTNPEARQDLPRSARRQQESAGM